MRERMDYDTRDSVTHEEESEEYLNQQRLDVSRDAEFLLGQSESDSERYEERGGVHHQTQFETDDGGKRNTVTDTENIGNVHAAGSTGATGVHLMSRACPDWWFLEMPDPKRAKPRERGRHPGDTPEET